MRLRARLEVVAVAAVVLLAGAGGAWLGVRLGHAVSEPTVERVTITAPEMLAGAPPDAARSPGGFTGFGGPPAIRGEVQRSGTIQSATSGVLVIGSSESSVTVRYTSPERLFRIAPAVTPLRVGDLVQVRVEDGRVAAILRLPPGLEQGGNRPR
ncbi:MAG: hypothetical protein FJ037_00925 [Chloroflexi bacterium]|nr:hypothetical protein [Chloroflexota bacterium]